VVERTDAVRKAWQSLPKGQKEVIALDLQDYMGKETAEILNISTGSVRQRRLRAIRRMKDSLT